ncbi:unnamed protein product, partial [Rotaria magnacalcarata]
MNKVNPSQQEIAMTSNQEQLTAAAYQQ